MTNEAKLALIAIERKYPNCAFVLELEIIKLEEEIKRLKDDRKTGTTLS
jgi:hypothetical protein